MNFNHITLGTKTKNNVKVVQTIVKKAVMVKVAF